MTTSVVCIITIFIYEKIDRTFVMLSNVFMALKDFPADCPDEELVKYVDGLSRYAKLALNRIVDLLTKD